MKKQKTWAGIFENMSWNIPGGNFLGGNFPGGNSPGGIWLVGIFRVGVFLIASRWQRGRRKRIVFKSQNYSLKM